ncbi:MAG TPA: YbhB/YbcL family Raf kinase inhibitor-like protein, partial [Spirochaetota bacterium]|nr:YbhB/YbcL family Raf kinase inhibitor-like protein [Spirochaetota bacterium]
IICDDPDAPSGAWVHWVIYNIPPSMSSLDEGIDSDGSIDDGITQGINDFGGIGYGGPMPPRGSHRYVFKIFALDAILPSRPGITKAGLLKLMSGHILTEAKLTGKYSRS